MKRHIMVTEMDNGAEMLVNVENIGVCCELDQGTFIGLVDFHISGINSFVVEDSVGKIKGMMDELHIENGGKAYLFSYPDIPGS